MSFTVTKCIRHNVRDAGRHPTGRWAVKGPKGGQLFKYKHVNDNNALLSI